MKYALLQFAQNIVDPGQVNIPKADANDVNLQVILRVVFALAGAICVLIVTIAGLTYILSNGDPQKTARSKDTILYALIGLAVSILAFTIVTFVIGRIF